MNSIIVSRILIKKCLVAGAVVLIVSGSITLAFVGKGGVERIMMNAIVYLDGGETQCAPGYDHIKFDSISSKMRAEEVLDLLGSPLFILDGDTRSHFHYSYNKEGMSYVMKIVTMDNETSRVLWATSHLHID